VACSWRIRHKLMLGMGLVVGLMGFLLAGTLKGLTSYKNTMRTFEGKLAEQQDAVNLRERITFLASRPDDPAQESIRLFEAIKPAQEAFARYQAGLLNNVQRQNDAELGMKEYQQVEAIKLGFDNLLKTLEKAKTSPLSGPSLLAPDTPLRQAVDELAQSARDLIDAINDDMKHRIDGARDEYRTSVAILVGTSVLTLLVMMGLLRFFYTWVVTPVRDLEQGVSRVARGDFEHRIKVNSGDEIEELAAAFNDMTARLRDMYANLAQQVNDRSRQLVRSERLAGVGFLAAGVAHEINNPLAAIAMGSEALESRLTELFRSRSTEGIDRDTINKYLKMIQDEAFRCKEITQRLLAFSRGGERTRESTDLAGVLQGVLDVVQHLPSSKGKQLVFEPPGPIAAWVNGQEVKQVFLNLVVNALDSMDEGGKLTITSTTHNGMIELAFQDTGCGMTDEVLENIFEPFFTRSRTGKGTGLGLSISHRIITQHGGDIEATSAGPGQGSTFRVRLPIEAPPDAAHGDEEVLDPEEEFLKLSSARAGRRAA
jgi:two-component system, NtrC family, sensor kinase